MKPWLLAAAAYNLAWGAAVVAWPVQTLAQLGMPEATPQLWQCIGMIVGVYGVGYAIASSDPMRHWPIVLVGLLGKLLGPLGFLGGVIAGDLPWQMGWTILTNDLLWWLPFTMILWAAARHHRIPDNDRGADPPQTPSVQDVLRQSSTSTGESLWELSQRGPILLVLLRHLGCTFCREALADVKASQQKIASSGAMVVLVHMSLPKEAEAVFARFGLEQVVHMSDPGRRLYQALELGRGTLPQLLGPIVWWRGFVAGILRGHGAGRLQGDGFQMPGAFLIHQGRVLRSYRHRHAADRPDYCTLAEPPVAGEPEP